MIYLAFLGGVLLGSIITQIIIRSKSVGGKFKLIEIEPEDGYNYTHNIIISMPDGINLLNKKRIILDKDNSHK